MKNHDERVLPVATNDVIEAMALVMTPWGQLPLYYMIEGNDWKGSGLFLNRCGPQAGRESACPRLDLSRFRPIRCEVLSSFPIRPNISHLLKPDQSTRSVCA
jgi:hypothetical protein